MCTLTAAGRKAPGRAQNLTCQVAFLMATAVKSAFALLSTKVTKHIPPQLSPGGLALAGIYFGTVVCADQIGEINDEKCNLTESRLEEENDEQEIFAGAVNG